MKYVLTSLGLAVLGIFLFLWYNISDIGLASSQKTLSIFNESGCNLQSSLCSLNLNGDTGTVIVSPQPFHLNEKITIFIQFQDKRSRNIQADLKGLDMDMGFNRFKFQTKDSLNYETSFNLPTCTKDYMGWLLGIYKNEQTINTYKFLAEKRKI